MPHPVVLDLRQEFAKWSTLALQDTIRHMRVNMAHMVRQSCRADKPDYIPVFAADCSTIAVVRAILKHRGVSSAQ